MPTYGVEKYNFDDLITNSSGNITISIGVVNRKDYRRVIIVIPTASTIENSNQYNASPSYLDANTNSFLTTIFYNNDGAIAKNKKIDIQCFLFRQTS